MSDRHYRFSAKTHVGRVRKVNEDAVLTLAEEKIWLVSDGVGGHEAGDLASRLVVDAVALIPPGLTPAEKMPAVRAAIQRAHAAIRAESRARGGATIGATVVILLTSATHFAALWAGDSRLYRMRDGKVEMLTQDHSVVAALVEAGQMTWDEAEHHPQSNAITRAVGVGDELELDKVRGEVAAGDRFLLCSDGLSKYAGMADVARLLRNRPIEIVADELVQFALDNGGGDNISVIVVDAI